MGGREELEETEKTGVNSGLFVWGGTMAEKLRLGEAAGEAESAGGRMRLLPCLCCSCRAGGQEDKEEQKEMR